MSSRVGQRWSRGLPVRCERAEAPVRYNIVNGLNSAEAEEVLEGLNREGPSRKASAALPFGCRIKYLA